MARTQELRTESKLHKTKQMKSFSKALKNFLFSNKENIPKKVKNSAERIKQRKWDSKNESMQDYLDRLTKERKK